MSAEQGVAPYTVEAAVLSDTGTQREHNEDHGALMVVEDETVIAVADGVSGGVAGETASTRAVEALMRGYREENARLSPGKRLLRAVQRANIDVHDLALMVPELRGMSTTLTALVVHRGRLMVGHVGDCRLYRLRGQTLTLLTKDHTVTAGRVRLGLMSEERARRHPDRATLTRSLGRELIAAVDNITTDVQQGDTLICCSDGLYNVLPEPQIAEIAGTRMPALACRALVDAANKLGTTDNLTAAVLKATGPVPEPPRAGGVIDHLRRLWR